MYVSICVCMYVCDDKIITMGRKMSGFKKVGLVYFSGFLPSFHLYCFFLLLRFIYILYVHVYAGKKLGCEKVSTVHFLSYSNFFHFHFFFTHFIFYFLFLFFSCFFLISFFLFGSNTLFIIAFCLFDNFFISLFPLKIRVVHLLLFFFLMEKF